MNILIFVLVLFVLIVVHEFGHFFVAKKFGMRVDEFSFGFPPKLFGKKIGETTYKFNLIPLGGYVKIYGEDGEEDKSNKEDSSRNFINKPRFAQALVLFAGVFMNFVLAWVLLTVGFVSGVPASVADTPSKYIIGEKSLTITSILPGSPAENANFKSGDKIISIKADKDNFEYKEGVVPEDIIGFIKNNEGQELKFSLLRNTEEKIISVTPKYNKEKNQVMVGFTMDTVGKLKLPIHKAIWEGLKFSAVMFYNTAAGFVGLIHKALIGQGSLSSVTGPIGIVSVVGDAASFGFVYLLSFMALISINLAVINLIPFPALDGGRLLFLLIEKIKGSRIKPVIANWANTIGFFILIGLMVLVTFKDISKFF